MPKHSGGTEDFMNLGLLDIALMFYIYGFLGWCMEVAYCGVNSGKFTNRGFLNGPICPIYGTGGMIVILSLLPIKEHTVLLYVMSVIITSALELITGLILEKLYRIRWWDYSDVPFNFKGFICLKFSLVWGLVCMAVMYGVNPVIQGIVVRLHTSIKIILVSGFTAIFISDIIVTVVTIKKLRVRLVAMRELADKIHDISDDIGEHVFTAAENAVKKYDEIKESDRAQELKEKCDELKDKYDELVKEKSVLQNRMIKAFPTMKAKRMKAIEHIREYNRKRNEKK